MNSSGAGETSEEGERGVANTLPGDPLANLNPMTHLVLTGRKRERRLNDPCEHCGAQAGLPCENDYVERYRFYCPEPGCVQLYETISGAMSCTVHRMPDEPKNLNL